MKYSGIDLHSNNSVVVVSDEADRVLVRRRMPNDAEAILALLAGHREQLVGVVVESTYNWYWLVDALQAAGYRVHLANTAAIKRCEGLKPSGDEDDAAYLAQLLRLEILPSGYICPPAARAVRDLARKRMQLVRSRTAQVLSVENMLSRETGAGMRSRAVQRLTAQAVEGFGFNPEVEHSMCANVAVINTLNREIDKLEWRLYRCVRLRSELRLLTSVPGIGQTLATLIMLEVGTIERFATAGNFASYARCVDSARISNGRKKGQSNVKNGNAYLAWAFVEAANFAQRYCAEAPRFYERKKARTNGIVATKALAHKLAPACYHMLKENKPFDVNVVSHEPESMQKHRASGAPKRPARGSRGADQCVQLPSLGYRRKGRRGTARRHAGAVKARDQFGDGRAPGHGNPGGAQRRSYRSAFASPRQCAGAARAPRLPGRSDVLAFTGSGETAARIRVLSNIVRDSVRVNVEADSLNAAVLGPDVAPGSEMYELFLNDVQRDMTQKAGQKCTAIRRVIVPARTAAPFRDDLAGSLEAVRVGNPALEEVRMGPLATASQLAAAREGIERMAAEGRLAFGSTAPLAGAGVAAGRGYFISPVLVEFARGAAAASARDREVFGPVASVLPYGETAAEAAAIVIGGNGGLVSSVYSEDGSFVEDIVFAIAPHLGRIYLGHPKIEMSPGPGTVLPQLVHGGPGRAGGGEELGGLRALALYMQRVALEGPRPTVEKLVAPHQD